MYSQVVRARTDETVISGLTSWYSRLPLYGRSL